MSFEGLYRWLEVQHARGESRNLYDPSTKQLLHRYKLPFKAHMVIPPPRNELFKWRKGAKRLSSWMEVGGLVPIADGIIEQQPPTLVDTPPLQSRREQAGGAAAVGAIRTFSSVMRTLVAHLWYFGLC